MARVPEQAPELVSVTMGRDMGVDYVHYEGRIFEPAWRRVDVTSAVRAFVDESAAREGYRVDWTTSHRQAELYRVWESAAPETGRWHVRGAYAVTPDEGLMQARRERDRKAAYAVRKQRVDELAELLNDLPKHREINGDDIAEVAENIVSAGWRNMRFRDGGMVGT